MWTKFSIRSHTVFFFEVQISNTLTMDSHTYTTWKLNLYESQSADVTARGVTSLFLSVCSLRLHLGFKRIEFVHVSLALTHAFEIQIHLFHGIECGIVVGAPPLRRREVALQSTENKLKSCIFHVLCLTRVQRRVIEFVSVLSLKTKQNNNSNKIKKSSENKNKRIRNKISKQANKTNKHRRLISIP